MSKHLDSIKQHLKDSDTFLDLLEAVDLPEAVLIDHLAECAMDLLLDSVTGFSTTCKSTGALLNGDRTSVLPRIIAESGVIAGSLFLPNNRRIAGEMLNKLCIEQRILKEIGAGEILADDITPELYREQLDRLREIVEDSQAENTFKELQEHFKSIGAKIPEEKDVPFFHRKYNETHAKRRRGESR